LHVAMLCSQTKLGRQKEREGRLLLYLYLIILHKECNVNNRKSIIVIFSYLRDPAVKANCDQRYI